MDKFQIMSQDGAMVIYNHESGMIHVITDNGLTVRLLIFNDKIIIEHITSNSVETFDNTLIMRK